MVTECSEGHDGLAGDPLPIADIFGVLHLIRHLVDYPFGVVLRSADALVIQAPATGSQVDLARRTVLAAFAKGGSRDALGHVVVVHEVLGTAALAQLGEANGGSAAAAVLVHGASGFCGDREMDKFKLQKKKHLQTKKHLKKYCFELDKLYIWGIIIIIIFIILNDLNWNNTNLRVINGNIC